MAHFPSMGKVRGCFVCHILISGEDRINRCPYYPKKISEWGLPGP